MIPGITVLGLPTAPAVTFVQGIPCSSGLKPQFQDLETTVVPISKGQVKDRTLLGEEGQEEDPALVSLLQPHVDCFLFFF